MKIVPLAMPKIDLRSADEIFATVGECPKSKLESRLIRPEEPRAALYYFECQHLSYIFGIYANQEELDNISFHDLTWQVYPVDVLSKVVIISGTLYDFVSYTLKGMKRLANIDQRRLCTQIYQVFRGANIIRPWEDYETANVADGTMILRSRT